MFSSKYTAAAAALFSLIASTEAVFDAAANKNLAMYYGQGFGQKGLKYYCDQPDIDIIPIGFLNLFPQQGNGYPQENFGNNCWAGSFYTGPGPDHSKDLLFTRCPQLQEDIVYCQKNTKTKILLSLGGDNPDYQVSGPDAGIAFADFLWGAYGPLTSAWTTAGGIRPLDRGYNNTTPDAVIEFDGFDFDIEHPSTDGQAGFIALINRLRSNFATNPTKQYLITGSPQCPLPEKSMGAMITACKFDALWVQFYNNGANGCTARNFADNNKLGQPGNSGFNYDDWSIFLSAGASSDAKLYIGLLGDKSDSKAPGDYVTAAEAKDLISIYQSRPNFGGVMLWEATGADINTQVNDIPATKYCGMNYYAAMRRILDGTPAPEVCGPITSTSTTSTMTSTSKTSTSSKTSSTSVSTTKSSTSSSATSTSKSSTSSTSVSTSKSSTSSSATSTSKTSTSSSATSTSATSSSTSSVVSTYVPTSTSTSETSSSSTSVATSYSSSETSSSSTYVATSSSTTETTSSYVASSSETTSESTSVPYPTSKSSSEVSSSSTTCTSSTYSGSGGVTSTPYPTGTSSPYVSYPISTSSPYVTSYPVSSSTSTNGGPYGNTTSCTETTASTTAYTVSTVYATSTYTITSCAPYVTDCPASIGKVTTETIALYTTYCPVEATKTTEATVPAPTKYTTSTVYATSVYTVTSCAPTVTNCPAQIGKVTTEIKSLYTTVCPVTETTKTPAYPVKSDSTKTTTTKSTFTTYLTVNLVHSTATIVPMPYPTGPAQGTKVLGTGLPVVSVVYQQTPTPVSSAKGTTTAYPTKPVFTGAASSLKAGAGLFAGVAVGLVLVL